MSEEKDEMAGKTLARYIKGLGLTIDDLVNECGRSKYTLYGWWKRDKQLVNCVVRAALAGKLIGKFNQHNIQDRLEG